MPLFTASEDICFCLRLRNGLYRVQIVQLADSKWYRQTLNTPKGFRSWQYSDVKMFAPFVLLDFSKPYRTDSPEEFGPGQYRFEYLPVGGRFGDVVVLSGTTKGLNELSFQLTLRADSKKRQITQSRASVLRAISAASGVPISQLTDDQEIGKLDIGIPRANGTWRDLELEGISDHSSSVRAQPLSKSWSRQV